MFPSLTGLHIALACLLGTHASADEREADVKSAVARGLARVTQAGINWRNNESCFSCHHQTLPMLAMTEAERAGFPLDKPWLHAQAENAHEYFQQRIDDMDEGQHVPGGAATAGYGLWALSLDQRPADTTTTAIVTYLVQIQGVQRLKGGKAADAKQPRDMPDRLVPAIAAARFRNWRHGTGAPRPRTLCHRGAADQGCRGPHSGPEVSGGGEPKNQQDRLWQLWGSHFLSDDVARKAAVRAAVIEAQQADGGWPQTAGDPSDAYSTGQALFMLCKTGASLDSPAVLRARDYLLKSQLADGSWRVECASSSKAQPYFDNGDPHGEHQFLSTAATSWATAGLCNCCQGQERTIR